jgi:hypothetical protein
LPGGPCGPTPPLVVMFEVDDDTVAETPCCVTVAEIGDEVTETLVIDYEVGKSSVGTV